jgi:Cdc6-like AAA superfamily ATPase
MMSADWTDAAIARAKELFDHRTPIAEKKFLAGRSSEINRLMGAIDDRGAHAIIFGDRGVGKTSIARCIVGTATGDSADNLVCIRVNCDSADTYTSLWKKVFSQVTFTHKTVQMGFRGNEESDHRTLAADLGDAVTVHDVHQLLDTCGQRCKLVVVLDEFERADQDQHIKRLLADTVKTLADFVVPATIVFVGVGESLADLIHEHESLTRHLVEVPVHRLSRTELERIISDRLPELGMTIDEHAQSLLTYLSKGLPFYVHLLGRHCVIAAIERKSSRIEPADMHDAIRQAVANSKQALKSMYHNATLTNQTKSHYRQGNRTLIG